MIEQELLRNATQYSFIEVYKLLCELALSNKLNPLHAIRIRPVLGLQHARTQVVSVTKQDQPSLYYLNVNLPGLYGNGSPLPKFFTEELIQASHKDQNQTRLFLDIIHQRLYQLLYAANTQQSPHYLDQGRKNVYQFMLAMIGFKEASWLKDFPDQAFILRNINIIRHQKSTVVGLQKLLQNLFKKAQVSIEQCVNRDVSIAEGQKLALNQQANQISFSAVLGGKMQDIQSKIIVSISPLSAKEYKQWCLTPEYWDALQNMIKYFIGQPLLVDLQIDVVADTKFNLSLVPENEFSLGRNAWLKSSNTKQHITASIKLL
ncbi:hypothetical protein DUF1305 [Psychromonas ingrahamii 37]|uniref:Type VI secretion system baseplate subunit TssG n=1 Tax=Psychromonas ingrahamii (strain DSM 17664 / CCUG 51855 / 37) TaxID=357804 RepID=A1SQY2_PSYIN|nr:type VI secretion system baseplate subunit TssG [Psychromonas ingrahamii]ABM01897.1 hypothetical protein DUF1305 [Psychromonas ingrahamii 37]